MSIKRPEIGIWTIVEKDDRVLLGKRKNAAGAGTWAPPGGRLEFGESLHACALRELKEETGLVAMSCKEVGSWSHEFQEGEDGHLILFHAVIDEFQGEPQNCEPMKCEGWEWFRLDELPSPLTPSVAELFAKRAQKKRPAVGVGVVVYCDGKVLLGKRRGSHGEGMWAFPGGHLDHGETVEECALRELKEETGLVALSGKESIRTNNLLDDGNHYITFFVIVDEFQGEPQNCEPMKCEGWEWFSLDALPEPLFEPPQVFLDLRKASFLTDSGIDALLRKLLAFYKERDWEKFHSPKNLVMDLVTEASELMEPFRWLTEKESENLDEKTLSEVRDEIGDTFILLVYLANKLGLDPLEAAEQKLKKVGLKYPKELCFGKALKYTAYESQNK